MVHADLSTPSNVLAVVDIGNAGSVTRATDLTTLVWYTFQDPLLDGVRRRLWTRILDLVGWEGAAVGDVNRSKQRVMLLTRSSAVRPALGLGYACPG
jgi:hypothetical protein